MRAAYKAVAAVELQNLKDAEQMHRLLESRSSILIPGVKSTANLPNLEQRHEQSMPKLILDQDG